MEAIQQLATMQVGAGNLKVLVVHWGSRFTYAQQCLPVSPERGIFRPPPRSHLGETHANVACQYVGSATRCGHQLRVNPKVHEDGLRYNA